VEAAEALGAPRRSGPPRREAEELLGAARADAEQERSQAHQESESCSPPPQAG